MTDSSSLSPSGTGRSATVATASVAAVTALVAVAVLVAWTLDIEPLLNVVPGLATMKFNSALGFLLLAGALAGAAWRGSRPWLREAGLVASGLLTVLAAATLLQFLLGVDLGIDEVVVRDFTTATGDAPGRMSLGTAVCFLLAGVALMLLVAGRAVTLAQALGIATAVIAAAALLGYLFGVNALYSSLPFSTMAVHTAVLFAMNGLAIVALESGQGLARAISSGYYGGRIARAVLPVALLTPIALNWLSWQGARAGLYDTEFAFALGSLSACLAVAAIVWWGSFKLNGMQARVEAAATRSAYLAAVVEGSNDAIVSMSLDGTITSWNPAAERMYGYRAEEMLGRSVQALVPVDRQDEVAAILERVRRHERVEHHETVRLRKDGEPVEVSLVVSPVLNDSGVLIGVSKIARDITERARNAEELRQRTEELARSNKELELFAYVASHDLQEPLRAISGCLQLLGERYDGQLDEKGDKYIRYAIDGARRMQKLIEDLLAFSRVGRASESFRATSCERAVAAAVQNLELAIRQADADVGWAELPTVHGIPSHIGLLFQNLISNAVKFRHADRQPQVSIRAERQGDEYRFAVTDNGIGIDPQYHERAFAIFQRLHTAREYPGTGIGLALCKRIVEAHGGQISLESSPGEGTTVYFTLPAQEILATDRPETSNDDLGATC